MPPNTGRLRTKALTPAIGATVEGLDLSAPLADADVAEIRKALDEHLVLFFEGQSLTPVQQRDFAARFGPLYVHPFYPGHEGATEVMVLEHDATHRANSDRWHNDVTYLQTPPKAAVLYARKFPSWAAIRSGPTCISRTRRSPSRFVSSLRNCVPCIRSRKISRRNDLKHSGWTTDAIGSTRSTRRFHIPSLARTQRRGAGRFSSIKTSPRTSKACRRARATHCCACSSSICEARVSSSLALREGTVAFWDNRWTQHCALADYFPNRRRVRRATILGERPV